MRVRELVVATDRPVFLPQSDGSKVEVTSAVLVVCFEPDVLVAVRGDCLLPDLPGRPHKVRARPRPLTDLDRANPGLVSELRKIAPHAAW